MALTPAAHYRRGFHPSATAGTFGAAAAAGRVLGLDAAGIANAFGACGSQAAGSMQFLANGSWNKRYQVGAAAMNGLMAALLAKNGFLGAAEALEGKQGFLNGYTSEPRPERLTERLGEKWETLEIAVKPYPSCRYSHAALDAILALRARHAIRPDEVRSLKIGLPKTGIDIIAVPMEAKRRVRSIVEGQFSMPFLAAAAMQRGRFGWADYDLVGEEAIDRLAERVEVWNDPACEAEFPAQMAGSVEIVTGRGAYAQMVACPKGEPANFVTDAELRAKFTGLAAAYLAPGTVDAAIKNILAVEEARSLREVLRPALAAGRGASPATRVASLA
jgi:2-methylcitrate dehydratase PrpD